MTCNCDEIARRAYEESLRLKEIARKAKAVGDTLLANEIRAVSKTLLYMSLFIKTGDEKEINRLVTPYLIMETNMPKVAEEQARRTQVSKELCGNEL